MLPSHCDGGMLPYYARGGQQPAAAPLDHHRRYSRPKNVVEVAPSCPRCDSPNTKFCYYNNYSLSQPRYFCKGCRRYWTKGGSLRNVPVGGGCRKNRRGKSTAARSVAAVAAAVGTVRGGAAFSHHPFPAGTVRPDLLLEGMVLGDLAGGLGQHQQQPASADNNKPAAAADGSAIDLALLYAKFLNRHQPAAVEQCAAVGSELADTSRSGSGSGDTGRKAVVAPPDQPISSHDHGGGSGTLSVPASTAPGATAPQRPDSRAVVELSFSVDQSCYEYDSLVVGLQTDDDGGGDLILQSTWHREAKYEPFDPLLLPEEDAASLHDSVAGADDVWSSALACHGGLEAALCSRP